MSLFLDPSRVLSCDQETSGGEMSVSGVTRKKSKVTPQILCTQLATEV